MKTRKLISGAALALFVLDFATAPSRASVITNGGVRLSSSTASDPLFGGYTLAIPGAEISFDAPTPQFGLNPLDPSQWQSILTLRNYTVGNAQGWYLASYGDVFTEASSGAFPSFGLDGSLTVSGPTFTLPFYLAVHSYLASSARSEHPEYFGWVLLRFDEFGELKMEQSALAQDEVGIIIGTFDVVPEPSTYALLVMSGTAALWWARRRR
jgi:hypothetical protein